MTSEHGVSWRLKVEKNQQIPLLRLSSFWVRQVGWVSRENLADIKPVCKKIPAPAAQAPEGQDVNGAERPRNTREWIDAVLGALRQAKIVESEGPRLCHPNSADI